MKRPLQFIQDFVIHYFSRKRPRLAYEIVGSDTKEYISHQITSSSSSSHAAPIKYDVFINFRGADIRFTFLSHLVRELKRKQIKAFVDDEELRKGDDLLELFRAIEESQIALVIFSGDYASSKWCLEELVKITECRKKNKQIVIPIFYNVDPTDVRHQKGCFQNAFARYEEVYNVETKKWRTAMEEVGNISGFYYTKSETEAKLIEDIVQHVLRWLEKTMYKGEIKDLVGIYKPIADLRSIISCIESEVGLIGIWGMGGLGKTTIAKALFYTICSEFEGCCFLENVREQLEKNGITHVKNNLISKLLEENDLNIDIAFGVSHLVKMRLQRKKILIVLDDVTDPKQVKNLIEKDCLGRGSRIIVTTRDKHVIAKEADCIYKVQPLGSHDALELLKLHAFDEKYPQMNWHDELMMKVLEYAKGIPLALEVLGRFLYDKSAKEWESQMQKLQKAPCVGIHDVLKLSYEGLDYEEQNVFLYLACFFRNNDESTKRLLDASCGYLADVVLKTLENKALITVIRCGGDGVMWVSMHDLIREIGRSIEKSGKRKHLWDHNEICRVLKNGQGSKHIESITLDMSRIGDMSLSPDCLANIYNLKFLRFHISSRSTNSVLCLREEGLGILPSDIRLFHWDEYPSRSLPATLNAENLVELIMTKSRIKKLWSSALNLPNLKMMDLWGSRHLAELPDLSKASSLTEVNFGFCENLVSVHPSIFCLQNIEWVVLVKCERLEELPAIEALSSSLKRLTLSACTGLKHLPDSISKLTSLKSIHLSNCHELNTTNLHIIFDGLHSLRELYLHGCYRLNKLPENISSLLSLRKLSLMETNVTSLPENIRKLSQLQHLWLNNCRKLQSIPELPASLWDFKAHDCDSLKRVFTPTPQLLQQHITWAAENIRLNVETTFSFLDCPELDEDSLDAFEEYVKTCNEIKETIRRMIDSEEDLESEEEIESDDK